MEEKGPRPLGFGIEHPENLLKIEKGSIVVRYPEGYQDMAEENLNRLNEMVEYYKKELAIDFDFQLWMCNEKNWPEGGVPYGMPSCDQQNNAVLVSVKGGCIVEATLPQLATAPQHALDLFEQAGVSPEEGLEVFPLLLGYHEIGHLLMNENGFHNATRWFNEFLASYHGLAYMARFEPDLAAIWEANAYISPYSEGEYPAVTDLNAMNEGKIEPITPEGVKNYDWMQKEFMKLCVVINDDKCVRLRLKECLTRAGDEVVEADSGQLGIDLFFEHRDFGLVLIDTVMPVINGWAVCERLRQESNIPIIFLSDIYTEATVIKGFQKGCDDYIKKPLIRPYSPLDWWLFLDEAMGRAI